MFGNVARLAARPATAAAAAAVAANAAQGPAHARAPPTQGAARQATHSPAANKIVDRDTEGWVIAELLDEVVLFRPLDGKEVDEAASTVMHLWGGGRSDGAGASSSSSYPFSGPIIDEGADDDGASSSSGGGSDGAAADAIIEAAAAAGGAMWRAKEREQLEDLMAITTRLLRRPGMQREVVLCMMEDTEVRELMLRQCSDLDRYLLAAGITNPHLLPPPPTASDSEEPAGAAAGADSGAGGDGSGRQPDLVSRLVGVVAGALERAGDALASLGGWLRRHVAAAFGQHMEEDEEEEEIAGAQGEGAARSAGRPKRPVNQVLGGVMVLAVAIFCVAVIRKPLVLRALSRRR